MNKNDILAYLLVLNHKDIVDKFSDHQLKIGRENMMGCLYRVEEQLNDAMQIGILILLRDRERANGYVPEAADSAANSNNLNVMTERLSKVLYSKYILAQ